jgi:hypothetical protein
VVSDSAAIPQDVTFVVNQDKIKQDKSVPSQPISVGKVGLCGDCAHARQIGSDRASTFLQCQLSFTDRNFQKYPRLPVLTCSGYERQSTR